MNGVLNLSVLDGWFDEAYELSGGWAIGDRAPYSEDQDEIHASAIYSTLENEIRSAVLSEPGADEDIPAEWVRRMKTCIANLTPRFGCGRMLAEYMSELYQPAQTVAWASRQITSQAARQKTVWDEPRDPGLEFGSIRGSWAMGRATRSSAARQCRCERWWNWRALNRRTCAWKRWWASIGVNGRLESTFTLPLVPGEVRGTAVVFSNEFTVQQTGPGGLLGPRQPQSLRESADTARVTLY